VSEKEVSKMEYDEIVRLAWNTAGNFRKPPTQTQIDRMIKSAKSEKVEMRGNAKKIRNVLVLGVFSILAALFIVVTHIQADAMEYPYFTLSLIFIVLIGYHMYTLIMVWRSIKKHILLQDSIVALASPAKDKSRLEKIYIYSVEDEALARYLEDTQGRTLTRSEADVIETLRKKAGESRSK
jgi:cation transport ATPase